MTETILILLFAFIPLLVLLVFTNEKINNTFEKGQLYYWAVFGVCVTLTNYLIYKCLTINLGSDESMSRIFLMVAIFFVSYFSMKFLFSMIKGQRTISK